MTGSSRRHREHVHGLDLVVKLQNEESVMTALLGGMLGCSQRAKEHNPKGPVCYTGMPGFYPKGGEETLPRRLSGTEVTGSVFIIDGLRWKH